MLNLILLGKVIPSLKSSRLCKSAVADFSVGLRGRATALFVYKIYRATISWDYNTNFTFALAMLYAIKGFYKSAIFTICTIQKCNSICSTWPPALWSQPFNKDENEPLVSWFCQYDLMWIEYHNVLSSAEALYLMTITFTCSCPLFDDGKANSQNFAKTL